MNCVLETLDKASVIKRRDDLIAQEMDGELVMLDMQSGQYFGLDSIASAIWQHIDQPITVRNLCAKLESEYDVSHERCLEDVLLFLNELHQKELINLL